MRLYFDWDIGARNDRRILALRKKFQWAGYGLFLATIEVLHENGGYIPRKSIPDVAYGLGADPGGYEKFLNACMNIDGLLKENEKGIYSERVLAKIEWRKGLSESGRKGGRPRKDQEILADPQPTQRLNGSTTNQSEPQEFISAMIISNPSELKECFGQQWREMAGMKVGADPKEFNDFIESWITKKDASGDYYYTKTKLRSYLLTDWERRMKFTPKPNNLPEKPTLKKLGQL